MCSTAVSSIFTTVLVYVGEVLSVFAGCAGLRNPKGLGMILRLAEYGAPFRIELSKEQHIPTPSEACLSDANKDGFMDLTAHGRVYLFHRKYK